MQTDTVDPTLALVTINQYIGETMATAPTIVTALPDPTSRMSDQGITMASISPKITAPSLTPLRANLVITRWPVRRKKRTTTRNSASSTPTCQTRYLASRITLSFNLKASVIKESKTRTTTLLRALWIRMMEPGRSRDCISILIRISLTRCLGIVFAM